MGRFDRLRSGEKKTRDHPFKFSKSGLEVSNPIDSLLIELSEYLDETVKSIGLTEEMIRKECESRLTASGIEILPGFPRPEYLQVSLSIKYRSFQILAQFNRPVLFEVGDIKYMKYSAKVWQKTALGQHGYKLDAIIERLGSLLDDFPADYLKANEK